jgi:hypothetical protein
MICLKDDLELEILIYQEVICGKSGFEVEDDEISVWFLKL